MKSFGEDHRNNSKNIQATDRRGARRNGSFAQTGKDGLIAELADLVRELHQTLLDHAPLWYTQAMDERIRQKLAAAEVGAVSFHD